MHSLNHHILLPTLDSTRGCSLSAKCLEREELKKKRMQGDADCEREKVDLGDRDPLTLEDSRLHTENFLLSSYCRCPLWRSISFLPLPWQPLCPAVWLKVTLSLLEPVLRVYKWLVLISWSHPADEANINAWGSPIPGTCFCESSVKPIHKVTDKALTDQLEGDIWRSSLSGKLHHSCWGTSEASSGVIKSAHLGN